MLIICLADLGKKFTPSLILKQTRLDISCELSAPHHVQLYVLRKKKHRKHNTPPIW